MDGITAQQVAHTQVMFRQANESIAETAAEYAMTQQIPLICECADDHCREIVQLSVEQYEHVRSSSTRFFTATGHEAAAGPHGRVVEQRGTHVVVENVGRAAEAVTEADPRRAS